MQVTAQLVVPLPIFIGFVSVSGLAKEGKVAEAEEDYDPAHDFYKRFRNAAVAGLIARNLALLQRVVDNAHESRQPHYATCLAGLEKWMRDNEYEVLGVPQIGRWKFDTVEIKVNPELLLRTPDGVFIAKMQFAKTPLRVVGRQTLGYLIEKAHAPLGDKRAAVLDVRRSTLRPCPQSNARIERVVMGEAAAFQAMIRGTG